MTAVLERPEPLQHAYAPHGAARELFVSKDRQIVCCGPAGSGKTRALLEKINLVCLLKPGTRVLLVRKVLASLTATGLVTWREKVVPELLAVGKVSFFGGNKEKPAQYIFHHDKKPDSVVVVGGMDKPSKIMSGEYDIIVAIEATELTLDDWQALSTRLRNGNLSYHQLLGDCNPDAPTHWIYLRHQEGRIKLITSTHRDNPQFYDSDGVITQAGKDYIEDTLGELTGVYRDRYLLGLWVQAEGAIYTEFDRTVHLVNKPTFDKNTRLCSAGMPWDWTRYWTIDFGFQHPFVLQRWAEDPDGALWLYGEQYMTHKIVEDHVRDLKRIVMDAKGNWTEPRPRKILADHDAEDRETFHRHFGHATTPADKTVKPGLEACMARLKIQVNGRPRVYFINGAVHEIDQRQVMAKRPTCTIDEFGGYVWADGEKEKPLKENDDGCDAFRYVVADRDLTGTTRYRSFTTGPSRAPRRGW